MIIKRIASYSLLLAGSQLILLLGALGIARLIGPSGFGHYSIFLSQTAILGVLLTLRFDVLVTSARTESEATLFVSKFFRFFSMSVIVLVGAIYVLDRAGLAEWKRTAPVILSAVATALISVMSAYSLNQGKPVRAAAPRLIFAICLFPLQYILLKWDYSDAVVLGHLAGLVGTVLLASLMIHRVRSNSTAYTQVNSGVERHGLFIGAGILNQICNNVPVQVVSLLFGNIWAGYFALANRILGAPLMLVGNAISVAMTAEVSKGQIRTRRVFRHFLVLAGLFLILTLPFSHPQVLALVDKKWTGASWVIAILIPVFAVRIAAIPAVAEINVARDGRYLFGWETSRLAILACLTVIGTFEVESWMVGYAACWSLFYVLLVLRGRALSIAAR